MLLSNLKDISLLVAENTLQVVLNGSGNKSVSNILQ